MSEHETTLRELNDAYIRAHVEADAAWYAEHLADDFICVRPDGSVIDKATFVAATRAPSGVSHYALSDVRVRIHGASGYVSALGSWRRQDGTAGKTRYIDAYVRTDGAWKVVCAQLTRLPA